MSLAILATRAQTGLNAPKVTVEVHLSNGLPAFNLVGLPETAVKESKDRVRSAIINSQFEFPSKRITINLAPADLPKEGGRYDLAIALGILLASGQIHGKNLDKYECIGELALTGELRPVKGCLPVANACKKEQHCLILPSANANEAALCETEHLSANSLLSVCAHLEGKTLLEPVDKPDNISRTHYKDFSEVKGQHQAKRALEIAASGSHNLLMMGPPGCGKSMLAERMVSILPSLSYDEALEKLAIESICHNQLEPERFYQRAYRAPHHSASAVALVGGGNPPKPGEISLAHCGVLFLDELAEFQRPALEALREPMESRKITISRANQQAQYPADFQLIAAMNPCPCGFFGSGQQACNCSSEQVRRYRGKISGPMLDRFDLHIQLQATPSHLIINPRKQLEENSASIAERVNKAKALQQNRQGKSNHLLNNAELQQTGFEQKAKETLETFANQLKLSARAIERAMRVSRTIADLEASPTIKREHIIEALSFRQLNQDSNCY